MKNNTLQKNIPNGWSEVPLKEVILENNKSTLQVRNADNSGHYPFFTSGERILSNGEYLVDGKNIYMTTGGVASIKFFDGRASYSTDTYSFKTNVDTQYIYYVIFNNIDKINKQYFSGSGLKHLQKNDFKNSLILLPPIKEQQKIAEILGAVDDNINKTQEVIEKTEKLKCGLMQEFFTRGIGHTKFKETDIGQIPEEWSISNTDDLLIDQKGAIKIGPFGSQLKSTFFVTDGYKVYGQENVFRNDFSVGNHFINEERFNLLKSCELHEGDFLISMMGTIGKCAIVPAGIETGIMDSHLLRLKIDEKKFDKIFILHFFTSSNLQKQIKSLAVGGIMAGLSSKVIKRLLYPTPTLSEQKEIANIISEIDEKISVNKKLKEKLILLKKGLMQDLLSGKVRAINI